jgi:hypothetical protein
MERGLFLLSEDELGCVSSGKHETEQGTKDAADEQAIKNVFEEISCDQTHDSAHGDKSDEVFPAGVQESTQHIHSRLCRLHYRPLAERHVQLLGQTAIRRASLIRQALPLWQAPSCRGGQKRWRRKYRRHG